MGKVFKAQKKGKFEMLILRPESKSGGFQFYAFNKIGRESELSANLLGIHFGERSL